MLRITTKSLKKYLLVICRKIEKIKHSPYYAKLRHIYTNVIHHVQIFHRKSSYFSF